MSGLGSVQLPVHLRVGDLDEEHVGDVELPLVALATERRGAELVASVEVDVRTALASFLRAVADEIEHPSGEHDEGAGCSLVLLGRAPRGPST